MDELEGLEWALAQAGVALFVTTLAIGHTQSSKPMNQLGIRPMGNGLWSWLRHSLMSGGSVGCLGYDPVLGSWSPLARFFFHISGYLVFWSFIIYFWSMFTDECCPVPKISAGIYSLVAYGGFFHWYNHIVPNVSFPGGPREHKIQRVPAWKDKTTVLDESKDWRCAVAHDSHAVTTSKFSNVKNDGLTGESFGRQIWTMRDRKDTSDNKGWFSFSRKKVDEKLVETMACGGRQPGFNPSKNPNSCDQVLRAQQIRAYLQKGLPPPDLKTKPKTAQEAAKKGAHFYSMLQTEDGHWAGDYGGPHFLMPGLIVAWYVMGKPDLMLDADQVKMMTSYIKNHQQTDGGWGTHIESPSTMFGSVLMYVALRLLGIAKNDPVCVQGRAFIQSNGGAVMTSSWAKFSLCLLGCMEWDGHNSVPPEMWLLPNWFPFHPSRLWCHCRMVYLPMGYLYGTRFVYDKAETDPLIKSLRSELYIQEYSTIDWITTRHMVADMDNYSPIPWVMRFLQDVLARYETWSFLQPFKNYVRKYGLKFCVKYMHAEDLQTNYIDIGPVNKVFNMISAYHAAGGTIEHPTVRSHFMRVQDYLWVAEDGMKMQGYNGSQCWDTSFAIQAFGESSLLDDFPEVSKKVWGYLERTQILSTETSKSSPAYKYESNEYRSMFYRHVSEGGWPFSTSAHGWPIADCTGEGLKGALCLLKSTTIQEGLKDGTLDKITQQRYEDAINVILTLQNEDSGWATYENNRGFGWFEQLNPSEAFGDIMIDYSYVELTMASLTAIVDFRELYPDHRKEELDHSIEKGVAFIKSIQREDGSWYGSWACCFTYGAWFGIEGLIKCGEDASCPEIEKACSFLLAHQRENGGWGEDFTSCYDKDYAGEGMKEYGDGGSGVVNTAWALLALSCARCKNVEAIKRGIKFLMEQQLPSGDWPQQGISGVFSRACGITYTSYRNVFPIWALGRCVATYGDALNE